MVIFRVGLLRSRTTCTWRKRTPRSPTWKSNSGRRVQRHRGARSSWRSTGSLVECVRRCSCHKDICTGPSPSGPAHSWNGSNSDLSKLPGPRLESLPVSAGRDRPRRSSLCWGQSVLLSLARMICTLDRHPRQLETSAPAADAVVFVSILSVSCARCVPLHAECSLIENRDVTTLPIRAIRAPRKLFSPAGLP